MALSIEEKYDEVRQLIHMGKEKGYLLIDEVNDMLPSEISSSDELDDIFSMFGSMGIEVVDSEQRMREPKEGEEGEGQLDLTPGALDKTNDPVRMYLREMGTVPLLTREGEVEIAKRIERGKKAVLKVITRTPMASQEVARLAERLSQGEIGVRDAVIFVEEEVTDEKL
jgi:RNA polymerase primary sigma factor